MLQCDAPYQCLKKQLAIGHCIPFAIRFFCLLLSQLLQQDHEKNGKNNTELKHFTPH